MSTTSVQISCATNAELLAMRNNIRYTEYYRSLIEDELSHRIRQRSQYSHTII